MASIHLCFLILALATLASSYPYSGQAFRVRRDVSPRVDSNQQIFYSSVSNEYGPPAVDQETHLQEANYNILNHIHSELEQIEALIRNLISQYSSIHVNTATIKTTSLPKEYGPPAADSSLYNAKFIKDNTETIQSSVNNLKSIAQNLENELNKHVKHPHSRLDTAKVPVIDPSQHYHINAIGVLPEFLTLDPFVGYGPSPNVNFAPPAPGATSGITVAETDIYSPPDGVLLAPPAPGQYPIRTKTILKR